MSPEPPAAAAQPVGPHLPGWSPRPAPRPAVLAGRWCRLEAMTPEHVVPLHAALHAGDDGRLWTYLPAPGPFADAEGLRPWVDGLLADPAAFPMAVLVDDRVVGQACYLRTDPANGVVEVGWIAFSPVLQRTTAATEALHLMADHAFALGYRRYEWKCDALNAPSIAAAHRLGFVAEGVHRQAVVVKGRNRDTAWFSILDSEWPDIAAAQREWLDPGNFDRDGRQRASLSELMAPVRRSHQSPTTGSTSGMNT